MKGIILAGGTGSRLFPLTHGVSKQLLPVYDKPMIYYPISVLMLAGIRDILIITTPHDNAAFQNLLGDGSQFGVKFTYKVQDKPRGIADAFILGEDFIGDERVCLILGDNIFFGSQFSPLLRAAVEREEGATVFAYHVHDPQRFGVVEFDGERNVVSIEEKPDVPKSNFCATGLYFYDNDVIEIAKNIKPSPRGEIEITCINNEYLRRGKLKAEVLGRGFIWMDTGTSNSLYEAGAFVRNLEFHQGFKVGCLEEIAYAFGWIQKPQLIAAAERMGKTAYGEYLLKLSQQAGRTF